jgi:DNA-binding LacI/PurR family transcriptional regulator
MTDVARLAGVSHQTVSRVLNDHPNVRPATRQRVLEAISALGYRPNLAARALVTGRSRTIGLVTLDTTLYGPISTLHGIEHAARDAGYYVSIVSLRTLDRASVNTAVGRLAEQAVTGIVVVAPLLTGARSLTAVPEEIPVVVVEGDPKASLPCVTVDQRSGAQAATAHLLSLGHRTVHHVSGPRDWPEARERLAGWRAALTAANAPTPEVIVGDWSARAGYHAGSVLRDTREATAFFVANDTMALGLYRACTELGLRVPEDISIVGFDDIAESEYFDPPLTTVRQNFAEVGRASIKLFLEQLGARRRSSARVTIAPELVVRASTAPPP